MNYITHEDVLKVIEAEYPYDGIVYLCANKNITLGEIANLVSKKIEFGNYKCEHKSIFTDYNTDKTSKDNVTKFIEEMKLCFNNRSSRFTWFKISRLDRTPHRMWYYWYR